MSVIYDGVTNSVSSLDNKPLNGGPNKYAEDKPIGLSSKLKPSHLK